MSGPQQPPGTMEMRDISLKGFFKLVNLLQIVDPGALEGRADGQGCARGRLAVIPQPARYLWVLLMERGQRAESDVVSHSAQCPENSACLVTLKEDTLGDVGSLFPIESD